MKKLIVMLYVIVCMIGLTGCAWGDIPIDEAHFPDPAFRQYVTELESIFNFGNSDGILTDSEIQKITYISGPDHGVEWHVASAYSYKGIEFFYALETLNCNEPLKKLNLSKNTKLKHLSIPSTLMTIDLSNNLELESVALRGSNMTNLDLSNHPKLKFLHFDRNDKLSSVNVSGCSALEEIEFEWYKNHLSPLTTLNIQGCLSLKFLNLEGATLSDLDVSGYSNLEELSCSEISLKTLNASKCTALKTLYCSGNQIKELDVSGCTSLKELSCSHNQITKLDVSGCTSLKELSCSHNQITKLDVSGCASLEELYCSHNQIKELDLSDCHSIEYLKCDHNDMTYLDLSKLNKPFDKYDDFRISSFISGLQEFISRDLQVKKNKYGFYEIDFKQLMPVECLHNVDPNYIGFSTLSLGFVRASYDSDTGIATFDHDPGSYFHYLYNTNAPGNVEIQLSVSVNFNKLPVYNDDNDPVNMTVDVLERGGFGTDNIICNMDNNHYYGTKGTQIDESYVSKQDYSTYGKLGFATDGNSRLILRVQTDKPGRASFNVIETVEEGELGYQASAVLIAPENFPSKKNFPSDKFKVHINFEADDGTTSSKDIELKIEVAPVVLIPGLLNDAIRTFGVYGKEGVRQSLKDKKFKEENIFLCDYDASRGVGQLDKDYNKIYETLKNAFNYYAQGGIVCTRADIVAHGLGGLMARKFLENARTDSSDGNNWSVISYKQGMVRRLITVATPHKGTPWADNPLSKSLLGILTNTVWDSLIYDRPVINALLKPGYLLMNLTEANNWLTIVGEGMKDIMTTADRSYGYPSGVPMYAIYGNVKDKNDVDTFVGGTMEVVDRLTGKNFAVYNIKTHIFDYLPKLLDKNLSTQRLGRLLKNAGVVYNVPEYLGLGMNAISALLFDPEPHDMVVSVKSAAGDFEGYSTGFINGTGFMNDGEHYHWSICRQEDVGDEVANLLKGSVTRFKTFGSNTRFSAVATKANLTAEPEIKFQSSQSETETENFNFIDCLKLQVWTPSSETFKFKVQTNHLISYDIFCFIDAEDVQRYFKIPVPDKTDKKFEVEVSSEIFSGIDVNSVKIYCFSRNPMDKDGSSIYASNIVTEIAVSELPEETENAKITIITSNIPDGNINTKYNLQLEYSGTQPVIWSVTGLPNGLGADEAGLISGTPKEAGKFNFSVTVIDTNGAFASKNFTINILTSTSGREPESLESKEINPETPSSVAEAIADMTLEQIANIESLVIGYNITSLTGIEKLTNLKTLELSDATSLTEVNLNGNTSVKEINLSGNSSITTLNLADSQVEIVNAEGCNSLEEVNIEGNTTIKELRVSETNISSLNAKNCENLELLECSSNKISSLNLEGCMKLRTLDFAGNAIRRFNAEGFARLETLICAGQQNRVQTFGHVFNLFSFIMSAQISGFSNSATDENKVFNVKSYNSSGREISSQYNPKTGEITFSQTPAKVTYDYNTGFENVLMDVAISAESETSSVPDTRSSGGGCNSSNISTSLLIILLVYTFGFAINIKKQ